MPEVDVTAAVTEDALVLRLAGELDAMTATVCRAKLASAAADLPPPRLVVLDLRDVSFCGAAGARLLARFSADCAYRAVRACIVARSDSTVARVLDLVGLDDHLPVYDELAIAVKHYA